MEFELPMQLKNASFAKEDGFNSNAKSKDNFEKC